MFIRTGTVLHDDRLEAATDLRTEGGRITAIAKDLRPEPGEQVLDATGCYVLPGLIDLHNHGVRHVMAQYDSLVEYARLLAAEGVTACLPTLLGSPQENMEAMRRGLAETDNFRLAPNLIGFRPEITYLAKTGAGAAGSLSQDLGRDHRGALCGQPGNHPHLGRVAGAGRRHPVHPLVPGARHRDEPGPQLGVDRAGPPGRGRGPEPDHPLL